MNLLFCINANFVSLWKTCMKSILLNGGADHYNAYILHSDLSQKEMDEMSAFMGSRGSCSFISVPSEMFEGFPESERYPKQIYYRIAAPLLLPKGLGRILYLDVDLVVINSLLPMYESDFEGAAFMACSHTKKILDRINQIRLGIEENVPYINSGVMLLKLAPYDNGSASYLENIRSYANKYKHRLILPDQDIITAIAGHHVKLLDTVKYNLSDRVMALYNADLTHPKIDVEWVRQNAVIIHYFGKNKPWKKNYKGQLGIFYQEILRA